MARTVRNVPAWVSRFNAEDMADASPRFARYIARAMRGNDGAFRSDNKGAAFAGKLDNWSSAPKGRKHKRIATKQARRFNNGEAKRQIDAEYAAEVADLLSDAARRHKLARLADRLAMDQEELAYYERMAEYLRAHIAETLAEIDEIS